MSYTKREREILDNWPTVTAQDLTAMNDLFPHYLFFSRAGDLMGLSGINLCSLFFREFVPRKRNPAPDPGWKPQGH